MNRVIPIFVFSVWPSIHSWVKSTSAPSHFLSEFLEIFTLKSKINRSVFEYFHNFFSLLSTRFGKKIKPFFWFKYSNHDLRKSSNKII